MTKAVNRHLRLYVIGAWYSYRALFSWLNPWAYLSAAIVYPLFTLMLFVFMGRFAGLKDEIYIVIGNVLLLTSVNGVLGVAMTVGNERLFRTLPYLLGSPAPRVPLFLGRALVNVINGILTVVVAIILSVLLFGLDVSHAQLASVFLCIIILSLSSSGLGLILGAVSLLTREGWTISTGVYLALFFLSGANFSVEMLPIPVQAISYALPMTRGIAATRLVFAGAGWPMIGPLLAGEILVGLVYICTGYVTFTLIEKWSLVSGQLESI